MKNRLEAYAIVRIDEFPESVVPLCDRISVKEVVWTLAAAKQEVARLSTVNAGKHAAYFWKYTRVEPLESSGQTGPIP